MPLNRIKPALYLILILLAAIGFRFFELRDRGLYFPDETRYYRYAVEGCSVWHKDGPGAAMKFAGDTFSAKAGHTLLGVIWMRIFGISQYSVLTMNAALGVLTVLLVFLIMRPFYGNTAAFIGMLILALSAVHAYYSRSFMSHVNQTFFVMLAFYFYVLPLIKGKKMLIPRFLSGLLLGFSFTIHPTTAIYCIAFFIYEILFLFMDISHRLATKIAGFFIFFISIIIAPLTFLVFNIRYPMHIMWTINICKDFIVQRISAPVAFMLSRTLPVYEGGVFTLLIMCSLAYFIYAIFKYRRAIDVLIFLQSFGIFLYWELFSSYEKLIRQLVPVMPFFCISMGVLITSLNFKKKIITNIVKTGLILAIIVNGSYSAVRVLLNTRSSYGTLEKFLKGQGSKIKILTTSEYFIGTKDLLMPNLEIDVTYLSERKEISEAIKETKFDLLIVYPGEWLYKPEFRFAAKPVFTIKEPQYGYFPAFYEGLCFGNRLDLLKERVNPLSYSIAVYKIRDLVEGKEFLSNR